MNTDPQDINKYSKLCVYCCIFAKKTIPMGWSISRTRGRSPVTLISGLKKRNCYDINENLA